MTIFLFEDADSFYHLGPLPSPLRGSPGMTAEFVFEIGAMSAILNAADP